MHIDIYVYTHIPIPISISPGLGFRLQGFMVGSVTEISVTEQDCQGALMCGTSGWLEDARPERANYKHRCQFEVSVKYLIL